MGSSDLCFGHVNSSFEALDEHYSITGTIHDKIVVSWHKNGIELFIYYGNIYPYMLPLYHQYYITYIILAWWILMFTTVDNIQIKIYTCSN